MIYSEFYLQKKNKISVFIAIFLVLLLTVSLSIIFSRFFLVSPHYSQAAQTEVTRVEVVNLLPNQATIFWQTANKVKGYLFYKEKTGEQKIVSDDRDAETVEKGSYYIHYATLEELNPGQRYDFQPVIEDDTASINKIQLIKKPDGSSYSFQTPLTNKEEKPFDLASGVVTQANLQIVEGAAVILTISDCYPLFTVTKSQGDWLIPLKNFYDQNTLKEQTLSGNEPVKIEIVSEENKQINIEGTLKTVSPLPQTVCFGCQEDYQFYNQEKVLGASSNVTSKGQNITIIYPEEGAIIPGRIPLIKGTAFPNKEIVLTIEAKKTITAKISALADGSWSYLPPENLDIGVQVITIKTLDDNNQEITLQRKFTIIDNQAIEGKVLGVASGEPTIEPSSVPSPTLIASNPSPSVTVVLPTMTQPVSGGSSLTPIFSGFSLIFLGLGILLIF